MRKIACICLAVVHCITIGGCGREDPIIDDGTNPGDPINLNFVVAQNCIVEGHMIPSGEGPVGEIYVPTRSYPYDFTRETANCMVRYANHLLEDDQCNPSWLSWEDDISVNLQLRAGRVRRDYNKETGWTLPPRPEGGTFDGALDGRSEWLVVYNSLLKYDGQYGRYWDVGMVYGLIDDDKTIAHGFSFVDGPMCILSLSGLNGLGLPFTNRGVKWMGRSLLHEIGHLAGLHHHHGIANPAVTTNVIEWEADKFGRDSVMCGDQISDGIIHDKVRNQWGGIQEEVKSYQGWTSHSQGIPDAYIPPNQ